MSSFYIILSICLLSIGLYTWFFTDDGSIYDVRRILPAVIDASYWSIALFIPLLATGVIMEDRRNGMFRVLLYKPINLKTIIFGKLLAIIIVFLSTILITTINYITVLNFINVKISYFISVYIFLLMLAVTYSTISMTVACFFQHYWRSYLVSFLIILFLHYLSNYLVTTSLFEIKDFFTYININSHFQNVIAGGFSLSTYVYLLSISILCLFISIYKLTKDNL